MCQHDAESDYAIGDCAACAKDFHSFYDVERKPADHKEQHDYKDVKGDSDLAFGGLMNARLRFVLILKAAGGSSEEFFVV